jgi:Sulfotransferase domain
VSIQVIGAGFGRTGTQLLKAAIEQLLGGRCYHLESVFMSDAQLGHGSAWAEHPDRSPH